MDPSTVVSVVSWPFIQLGGLAVGIVQAAISSSTITVKNVVGAGTAVAGTTAVITGSGLLGLPTLAAGAGAATYYMLRR